MRISDWSSDVFSSDLLYRICRETCRPATGRRQFSADMVFAGKSHEQICLCGDRQRYHHPLAAICLSAFAGDVGTALHFRHIGHATHIAPILRSEEHTSELQSLMRISYAVLCLY